MRQLSYVCPRDRAALSVSAHELTCPKCGAAYPVVRGVPVLINDDESVFSISDYATSDSYEGASYGTVSDGTGSLRRAYRSFAVWICNTGVRVASLDAREAVKRIADEYPQGRLLVIGCGEASFDCPRIVYSDVAFGAHTDCICDAHSLPFPDGYFDGVLAVAVMEHVADPQRCADEIRRVLSERGYVYAVTPFLQPVHMGAHDFTRYTYLGHRRLFRWFDDVESGCALGPAASMAFVLQHIFLCISDSKAYRRVAKLVCIILSAIVRQFDWVIGRKNGAYDAAGGFFFFGRKRPDPISDRDIIKLYRGNQ